MNARKDLTTSTVRPGPKHTMPPRRGSTGGIASPRSEHEKIEEIRIKYRRRASDEGGRKQLVPRRRLSASSSGGSAASQQKARKVSIIRKSGSLANFEVIGALGTALQSDDGISNDPYATSKSSEHLPTNQQRRQSSSSISRSSDHRSCQSSQSSETGHSYSRGDSLYDAGVTCDTSVTPSEVTVKRRNSAKASRRNSLQKYAEMATMQVVGVERTGRLKEKEAQADKAGGGTETGTSAFASDNLRDQEIRNLKEAAESSQSSIETLTNEMRLMNKQLLQESKLKDEASRDEIASLKAELRASYKKNISISKSSKAEITRLEFELEKRDETISKLQEELEALKKQKLNI